MVRVKLARECLSHESVLKFEKFARRCWVELNHWNSFTRAFFEICKNSSLAGRPERFAVWFPWNSFRADRRRKVDNFKPAGPPVEFLNPTAFYGLSKIRNIGEPSGPQVVDPWSTVSVWITVRVSISRTCRTAYCALVRVIFFFFFIIFMNSDRIICPGRLA